MDIINKIDMYICNEQDKVNMMNVLEVALFLDDYPNMLNEGFDFLGKVKSLSDKIGIHTSKSGTGLIGMLYKSGKVMSEFIWNAMKAATGDSNAKERVVELAKTEIKKEDILDFLLRLDGVTLHLLTGPIHLIDNLTGWHIWANVHKHVQQTVDVAKKAIEELIYASKNTGAEIKEKIKKLLHGVASLFGLEDEHKMIQSI